MKNMGEPHLGCVQVFAILDPSLSDPVDRTGTLDPLIAGLAVVASMIGTTLAARVLEAMTDQQFRTWANGIITAICGYYVIQGAALLALPLANAK